MYLKIYKYIYDVTVTIGGSFLSFTKELFKRYYVFKTKYNLERKGTRKRTVRKIYRSMFYGKRT